MLLKVIGIRLYFIDLLPELFVISQMCLSAVLLFVSFVI